MKNERATSLDPPDAPRIPFYFPHHRTVDTPSRANARERVSSSTRRFARPSTRVLYAERVTPIPRARSTRRDALDRRSPTPPERRRHRVQDALDLFRGIHVPVPSREFGVNQFVRHRHLERARGRRRGFHAHGAAREPGRDRAFDGGGEAEVASAASVDYGHEGAHDVIRVESRSGDGTGRDGTKGVNGRWWGDFR